MARRKFLAALIISSTLIVSTPAVANATTSHPAGGTWNHGVRSGGGYGSGGQVYSYYQHKTRVHKASACNADMSCTRLNWHRPGQEARAIYAPASAGRNTAYYNVK